MSAPTNIDFVKGKDFTFEAAILQAHMNQLVDQAYVYAEGDPIEGKGLTLVTKDDALNTPSVPDASAVIKWKRYAWIRRPHSTATSTTPIIYVWNENAVSDATYLKWVQPFNNATLEAAIAALTTDVNNLDTTVSGLNSQVNALNIRVTDAEQAADDATEAVNNLATPLANRVTALEVKDVTHDNLLAGLRTDVDAAEALAMDVTADRLNDTLDLSAKTVQLFRQSPADYTITKGTAISFAHDFSGSVPKYVRAVMVCQTAEAGYAIGDEVDVNGVDVYLSSSTRSSSPFTVYANSTTIGFILYGTSASYDVTLTNRTTGARVSLAATAGVTLNNWKLRFYYGL